jgi:hypothetical protein
MTIFLLAFVFGCEELLEMEASSMTIERVTLEKMPFKNSSNLDWDELSGPDVYIRFEETSVNGYIETGTNQDISPTDLPIFWDLSPTFTLDDFSNNLKVYIYDDDVLSDDYIISAEFEFDPFDATDTFTLTIDESCELSIEVTYEY